MKKKKKEEVSTKKLLLFHVEAFLNDIILDMCALEKNGTVVPPHQSVF